MTDGYALQKALNGTDVALEALAELRDSSDLTPRSRAHLAAQAVRGATAALAAARALLVAEAIRG
jgi:hypothetical protein